MIFGNTTSRLGTVIYNIILAWWLIEETGTPIYYGYVSFAGMIPVFILSFFNGVAVDKLNKKYILILTDFVSAMVCLLMGLMVINNDINIPLIVLSSVLLGISSSLFDPASKSIIPEIVTNGEIKLTNSAFATLSQVINVSGPIIAAFFISGIDAKMYTVFFFNGLTFLISAFSECLISYSHNIKEDITGATLIDDMKDGFKYVVDNQWLLKLLIVSAIINFFIAAYNIVLPYYFKEVYSDNGTFYSLALTVEAVFGILAGITIAFEKKSEPNLMRNLLFCGISLLGLQVSGNVYICLGLIASFGYFLTKFNIVFFTFVHKSVASEMMGRVFSIITMIALSIMPLGNIVFAHLGDLMIEYVYYLSGGGIVLAATLVSRISLNEQLSESN